MIGAFTPTVVPTPISTPLGLGGIGEANVNAPTQARPRVKLPKNASRILFARGLPSKITSDELYDIFGKYGSIRQIRKGVTLRTRCTAFIVYDDIYDAKVAVDHLNGFNVAGRYLTVLYYDPAKEARREEQKLLQQENDLIREKSGFA